MDLRRGRWRISVLPYSRKNYKDGAYRPFLQDPKAKNARTGTGTERKTGRKYEKNQKNQENNTGQGPANVIK